ncbi:HugZ family pyridoxamine 5'-phosphate oxidase [Jiella pelagia]|uniref:Pyridoxamine 5'-phosphate oxidase family protein n=1 Tax=Jiella pelagia TaxID=2986949 RepID=A0ABY7C2R4_9HYPH|nr:pyridoxamine 5'-phosphate oxidase family protein [Jiella pelagia]WAP69516.1 pyridoxamine 5'-phosphate oxidase family protein [Jiella pelagia]
MDERIGNGVEVSQQLARNILQPVDEDARLLARMLLRPARDASLAVLRPKDGWPAASRALVATDFIGRPIILVSGLSLHAGALEADPRCSLLVGRSGKGDPLAHPRMTVFATARPIAKDSGEADAACERFLSRHPKAELYVDFPDFRFLCLEAESAALNGGFAKAFELAPSDLLDEPIDDLSASAIRARDHMNEDHGDAIDALAAMNGEDGNGWKIATADRRGFEIIKGDRLDRIEFNSDPVGEGGYRKAFVELVRE